MVGAVRRRCLLVLLQRSLERAKSGPLLQVDAYAFLQSTGGWAQEVLVRMMSPMGDMKPEVSSLSGCRVADKMLRCRMSTERAGEQG